MAATYAYSSEVLRETMEDWPDVPEETYWVLMSLPVLTLVSCCLWLRVLWPCPESSPRPLVEKIPGWEAVNEETSSTTALPGHDDKELNGTYASFEASSSIMGEDEAGFASMMEGSGSRVLEAGEVAGDYSGDWKGTFDMTLLVVTGVWLMMNVGLTFMMKPDIFHNAEFWALQIPKLAVMIGVSIGAGSICRYFCPVDDKGYIITSKSSCFKVNYTRKVQHFAAYLVPLLFSPSQGCNCRGTLEMSWGVWMTLIGFLVMIKPIREAIPLSMLQFNGLDRPEDRPHTLEWMIKYNIWPGEVLIVFFAHLLAESGQRDLVYIIVFVTGVGDGLAEPVGIWLGKHKYMARSCTSGTYYQRSFEGSCCVFIVTVATICMLFADFANVWEFLMALLTLPTALTLAEAFSPHTMDTPFIMGVGGALLYAIVSLMKGRKWVSTNRSSVQ